MVSNETLPGEIQHLRLTINQPDLEKMPEENLLKRIQIVIRVVTKNHQSGRSVQTSRTAHEMQLKINSFSTCNMKLTT